MIVIDANKLILGRMATFVAKKALLGEKIVIVNCSGSIITGDKKEIQKRYMNFRARGIHTKGPFYSRRPDYFVKRVIRGMLPKSSRGREVLKNITCFVNVPEKFQEYEKIQAPDANISKVPNLKFISVGEICKHLGGKI